MATRRIAALLLPLAMGQLFPVRGGDGNLKFAANDDGSCIAEKRAVSVSSLPTTVL